MKDSVMDWIIACCLDDTKDKNVALHPTAPNHANPSPCGHFPKPGKL